MRLNRMCLEKGNLQQQYLALLSDPTAKIDPKTIEQLEKNVNKLDLFSEGKTGIVAFEQQLSARQALYILNRIF